MDLKGHYIKSIKYCPACGHPYKHEDYESKDTGFVCSQCQFHYYLTPAPSVSVIITKPGNPELVLMTERNRAPAKGKLDFPGGFIKYQESAEEAASREIYEELGLTIIEFDFLAVGLEEYLFQGSLRSVLPIALIANSNNKKMIVDHNEIASVDFYSARKMANQFDRFAFTADYNFLNNYIELRLNHSYAKSNF